MFLILKASTEVAIFYSIDWVICSVEVGCLLLSDNLLVRSLPEFVLVLQIWQHGYKVSAFTWWW